MWKLTCLLAAFTAAGFAAGSGRILYSPPQPAVPFGASIKMTPDPSSIWSWHEDVLASGNLTIPVFIDIDGNGAPSVTTDGDTGPAKCGSLQRISDILRFGVRHFASSTS